MRAITITFLTILFVLQIANAQEQNSSVPPLNPNHRRHACPGAGYYDNVRTCCCVNNSTGQYCIRKSAGQTCNQTCINSYSC
jgi:hypothetical protein